MNHLKKNMTKSKNNFIKLINFLISISPFPPMKKMHRDSSFLNSSKTFMNLSKKKSNLIITIILKKYKHPLNLYLPEATLSWMKYSI
jgi:hypothetical protein